ncbi:GEVED domain-containing protein [Pacificibacter marinus]|uniref:GEVED domain-containing protein n=1 Tax=Pacificibacter marinus TaxID=658057 RepID=UPI001C071BF0|nr:GEVED domain-containing protein [Pacificibacter marinus]MBU2867515.1 hypothetical protein [Pacificibacter marinus]
MKSLWNILTNGIIASVFLILSHAAQAGENCGAACVFAGPRMASVQSSDSELLGPILGGLLGTDVGLSVLDWNAIAGADLNLLDVIGSGDVAVSNPGQLIDADITLLELVDASIAAAEADNDTALVSALGALRIPVGELSGTINLVDLITVDLPQGALANLELNALDLIGGAIQLYNYENVVTTTEPVALNNEILQQFGIGGAEVLLQVVEPPHFECGGAGTQFHTSTVRAKVSLDLADLALDTSTIDGLLGPLVGGLASTDLTLGDLDLYFEFGRVDGEVLSADPESKTASVILAPSAIDLFLGSIDDALFFNRDRAIVPSDIAFGTVGELEVALFGGLIRERASIEVKSFAQSAPGTSQTLFFSPPYPQSQSIGDGASSFSDLIGTLAQNLDIRVEDTLGNLVGPLIDTVVEPVLGNLVGGLLVDAISPVIDLTLDPLLGFFGVGIGEAEASISGVTSICVERSDCPVSGPAPNGSASARYGSPTHLIYDTLFMGFAPPDEDTSSRASVDALGDDESGLDDEDGVELPIFAAGQTSEIEITLSETGGEAGYLQGWIDWNGDGEFSDTEQIARDLMLAGGGVLSLSVTVPDPAFVGGSFARFRWSTLAGLNATEPAPDGEVEDYSVTVNRRPTTAVSGRILVDTGIGGGVAHDAVLNGAELGLDGVTVQFETTEGQIISVAQSDAQGNWHVDLPPNFIANAIVRVIPPEGYLAVSETSPLFEGGSDGQIILTVAAGENVSGLNFGLIPAPRFYQDGQAFVQAGQVATIYHDYVAETAGDVSFSIVNGGSDLANIALFEDLDCDGSLDQLVSLSRTVVAGERICLGARTSTSSGLSSGQQIRYEINAVTVLANDAGDVTLINRDVVFIGQNSGGLVIEKTVENITQGTGELRSNFGEVGDELLYRLKVRHQGLAPITNVAVYDKTPPYTELSNTITQSFILGDGVSCVLKLPDVASIGYKGNLRWRCDGPVFPGAQSAIEFTVRIAP